MDQNSMAEPNGEETSRFKAPDGGTLTLRAPGYDVTQPWSATVQIRTQRPYAGTPDGMQLREFHVARAGNYDLVIRRLLAGRWNHKVEAQGGHFMIAGSEDDDRGLALWRGPWHEVATWLVDPISPPSKAILRFAGLRFNDQPDGLTIEPALPGVETVEVIDVRKHIPTVGFLAIMPPQVSMQLVPSWSGAPLPTGEVWRQELSQPDEPLDVVLVHATPTTVALLHGKGNDRGREEPRLAFLEKLTELTWTSR